jgi:hypothetical protein
VCIRHGEYFFEKVELGSFYLDIKIWHSSFDPYKEVIKTQFIWVKISCMLMEIWIIDILKVVGRSLGKFVDVEEY